MHNETLVVTLGGATPVNLGGATPVNLGGATPVNLSGATPVNLGSVTPQPPGRTPRSAGCARLRHDAPRRRSACWRASGTTCVPAARTQPPVPSPCPPPARPSDLLAGAPPARRASRRRGPSLPCHRLARLRHDQATCLLARLRHDVPRGRQMS